MPAAKKFDINDLAHHPGLKLKYQVESPEDPEELKSRIRQQDADGDHQRWKDAVLFVGVLVLVGTVSLACLAIVLLSIGTADTQKSAGTLLTVIVSAAVGYTTGKGGVKSP